MRKGEEDTVYFNNEYEVEETIQRRGVTDFYLQNVIGKRPQKRDML